MKARVSRAQRSQLNWRARRRPRAIKPKLSSGPTHELSGNASGGEVREAEFLKEKEGEEINGESEGERDDDPNP